MARSIRRREFLRLTLGATAAAMVVGCVPAAPAVVPTPVPADPTPAPADPTPVAVEPTPVPAEPEPVAAVWPRGDVPRGRNLIWTFGPAEFGNVGICNGYATGFSHQHSFANSLEPMFYYTALNDKFFSHIAETYEYNEDATELTITVRKGVEWSDGTPFTARDIAFTYNSLVRLAPGVRDSARVQALTQEAVAVDDFTVRFVFPAPNFRYHRTECTFRFDRGIYIVPEHVFKDVEDWLTFRFSKEENPDWPVVTGGWKIWDDQPTRKVFDLRDDWWAIKTGLLAKPQVERITHIGFTDDTVAATQVITKEVDYTLDLRPRTIETILIQAPHVITHTGRDKPYGYVDWWPISVWFNCLEKPFDDRRVRWAIAYAIDQQQVVDIGWAGAGQTTSGPFPYYPALLEYIDTIRDDIMVEYNVLEVNLARSAELMEEAGFTKDAEGFWVDADGNRPDTNIWAGVPLFGDIAPVVAEQLRKAGFDSTHVTPPDVWAGKGDGRAMLHLFGHGGSVDDPFTTLDMYHIREVFPTGQPVGPNRARWSTEAYSAIVDELSQTAPDDPRTFELFREAMAIWYHELPEVPLVQWFHRIPQSTAFWTNWPTQENPYNSAIWHLTAPITMWSLQAVT